MTGEPFTILLVEDNPAHAELVVRSFEEHRIANHIVHVSDGETALEYLFGKGAYEEQEGPPLPHIILLDLRLPRIDGLEVLRQIKGSERLKRIPVIILTTSAAEQDAARAYERNVNSYVVKPIDFSQFTKLMDDLGMYWLGWNYFPWS
ncbi:response regulator [Rhodocaloribacter sp.]